MKIEPLQQCACGCRRWIACRTPEGRKISFAHGHRKLTPEESFHRREVFERISADPEYQRRRFAGAYMRPNKLEKRIIAIIEYYKLPFRYVGDGSLIIGKSNPDFISTDGSKKIVEVFGDYWHTIMGRTLMSTEEGRKTKFKELGYECMIIWESAMKKMTDQQIHERIIQWMSSHGGDD